MKAEPGTTAENNTGAILAGHKHTAEGAYTMVERPSVSYPGILVRYCAVCGSFIPETIIETPAPSSGEN